LLLTRAARDLEKLKTDLATALQNGNREEIRQTAHAVKGILLNLCLKEQAEVACRVENSSSQQKIAPSVTNELIELLEKLELEIEPESCD